MDDTSTLGRRAAREVSAITAGASKLAASRIRVPDPAGRGSLPRLSRSWRGLVGVAGVLIIQSEPMEADLLSRGIEVLQISGIPMSHAMTASCPFGHNKTRLIEQVSTDELVLAYRDKLGIDIEGEFNNVRLIDFRECADCALKFFLPALPGSERMYAQLSAKCDWYYSHEKVEFERAARRISPRKRVLEVGCGLGAFAAYLIDCQYTGIEFNQNAIAIAKDRGLDVRPETVEHMSKSNQGIFDVVCAFEVLEHVESPAEFIAACVECLRPGGLLMFSVPNSDGYLGVQADDLLSMPPHHLTWWGEEAFWRLANALGLEMIAVEAMPLSMTELGTFSRVVAFNFLRRRLGDHRAFCFYGRRYELLNRAAKIIARYVLAGMYDPRLLPKGHSLLAVLRRPLDSAL